jgi:hypothetical protein
VEEKGVGLGGRRQRRDEEVEAGGKEGRMKRLKERFTIFHCQNCDQHCNFNDHSNSQHLL